MGRPDDAEPGADEVLVAQPVLVGNAGAFGIFSPLGHIPPEIWALVSHMQFFQFPVKAIRTGAIRPFRSLAAWWAERSQAYLSTLYTSCKAETAGLAST